MTQAWRQMVWIPVVPVHEPPQALVPRQMPNRPGSIGEGVFRYVEIEFETEHEWSAPNDEYVLPHGVNGSHWKRQVSPS